MALKVARCDDVQCDGNDVQCDGNDVQCDGNDVQCDDNHVQCDGIHGGRSVHMGACTCDCTAANA